MERDKKTIQEYVCGFLFSADESQVALILKNRPEWQAGHLNGIGGHVETEELPLKAMRREFNEEAGVDIEDWTLFYTGVYGKYKKQKCENPHAKVYFYKAFNSLIDFVRTIEDEEVMVLDVGALPSLSLIPNLKWLIPLALDPYERPRNAALIKEITP